MSRALREPRKPVPPRYNGSQLLTPEVGIMLMALGGIPLGVRVVVLITALTGHFVAQEFAYMARSTGRG